MSKFDIVFWMIIGAALLLGARFGYLVAKKGAGWGFAKLEAWRQSAKHAAQALEGRIKTLETDVTAIKTKVGL